MTTTTSSRIISLKRLDEFRKTIARHERGNNLFRNEHSATRFGRPGFDAERWRVLVAITGTASGQRALECAIDLAVRSDTVLVGLVIQGKLPAYAATVGEVEAERERTAAFFETIGWLAVDQAAEHGVELQLRSRHGPLGRALRRELELGDFDLVVIGRPAAPLRRALTAAVVSQIPGPVLLAE